ncbi:MAG: hypothetical protein E6Q97_26895 [Desulfurellales bacterium]|nr:MAG: hypothetical protein E6Q97_26895 [Desulfurellales bacterium]
MGKKSAPKYDAGAAIAAQTSSNQTAQNANAVAGQKYGPYGQVTTVKDDKGNVAGQQQTLAATLQGAAGNLMDATGEMSSYLPVQPFKLADVPDGVQVGKALYDQGMNYMQPQFQQQRDELGVTLRNRGLPLGSEAEGRATGNLMDQQNRAMTDLAMRATLATPAEQQRQIQNALLERGQVGSDISTNLGLMAGIGGLAPQYSGTSTQPPVNATAAYNNQYQSELAAYNAKQQGINNLIKLGVGTAFAPMTGGTSLAGMGAQRLGLFNGAGSGIGPWDTTTTIYS